MDYLAPVCTAYILSPDGNLWGVRLSYQDTLDGVTIEDHIEFVLEGMMPGDEIVNIVIH